MPFGMLLYSRKYFLLFLFLTVLIFFYIKIFAVRDISQLCSSRIAVEKIHIVICHNGINYYFAFLNLCLPSIQQGNFNSSVGSDGYMLSILTSGMSPVTSITEGLQQVRFGKAP